MAILDQRFKCPTCPNIRLVSKSSIRRFILGKRTGRCSVCVKNPKLRMSPSAPWYTRTYTSWRKMKGRCYLQTRKTYSSYGGRGIVVCARWRNSFKNFLADMGERPQGTTLDRINPDGNYTPKNCRWATLKEQANNKRRSKARAV